jgi:hypothetical protein
MPASSDRSRVCRREQPPERSGYLSRCPVASVSACLPTSTITFLDFRTPLPPPCRNIRSCPRAGYRCADRTWESAQQRPGSLSSVSCCECNIDPTRSAPAGQMGQLFRPMPRKACRPARTMIDSHRTRQHSPLRTFRDPGHQENTRIELFESHNVSSLALCAIDASFPRTDQVITPIATSPDRRIMRLFGLWPQVPGNVRYIGQRHLDRPFAAGVRTT